MFVIGCFSGNLRKHMDAMHGSRKRSRFPCTFFRCEKTYLHQRHLTRHMRSEHEENPVQFPCTLCSKEFKCRTHLERHISSHTTEKTLNCAICAKNFAQMDHLKRHEVNIKKLFKKWRKDSKFQYIYLTGDPFGKICKRNSEVQTLSADFLYHFWFTRAFSFCS